MKRIFDILFSVVAIFVFLLPVVCIVVVIKFFYKHPILFLQDRVGEGRSLFKILKFQTMVNEKATSFGKVLRRSGLDELPQFINVLKGEMSIVGPRALTQYDVNRLGWNSSFHDSRWSIKPGITGLAQIYGGQHKKISWFWDKQYLKRANLKTDLLLLFISFLMNISGKEKIRKVVLDLSR